MLGCVNSCMSLQLNFGMAWTKSWNVKCKLSSLDITSFDLDKSYLVRVSSEGRIHYVMVCLFLELNHFRLLLCSFQMELKQILFCFVHRVLHVLTALTFEALIHSFHGFNCSMSRTLLCSWREWYRVNACNASYSCLNNNIIDIVAGTAHTPITTGSCSVLEFCGLTIRCLICSCF